MQLSGVFVQLTGQRLAQRRALWYAFSKEGGVRVKLTIEQVPRDAAEEITVRCHDAGAAWVQAVQGIAHGQVTVSGTADERLYRIPLRDIYYFEVVDGSSFLYCRQQVYGCRLRLYEFEALCSGTMLFRCSKSMVLNAEKLSYVRPSFSGRFEAVLDNGEKVIVSRLYVADLKRLFGA